MPMVGVRGFEPPAPASRTQCSTRLSYTPAKAAHIALSALADKARLQSRGLAVRCNPMQMSKALENRWHTVQHLAETKRVGAGEIGGYGSFDRRH